MNKVAFLDIELCSNEENPSSHGAANGEYSGGDGIPLKTSANKSCSLNRRDESECILR
jgi:hypothetical protein